MRDAASRSRPQSSMTTRKTPAMTDPTVDLLGLHPSQSRDRTCDTRLRNRPLPTQNAHSAMPSFAPVTTGTPGPRSGPWSAPRARQHANVTGSPSTPRSNQTDREVRALHKGRWVIECLTRIRGAQRRRRRWLRAQARCLEIDRRVRRSSCTRTESMDPRRLVRVLATPRRRRTAGPGLPRG